MRRAGKADATNENTTGSVLGRWSCYADRDSRHLDTTSFGHVSRGRRDIRGRCRVEVRRDRAAVAGLGDGASVRATVIRSAGDRRLGQFQATRPKIVDDMENAGNRERNDAEHPNEARAPPEHYSPSMACLIRHVAGCLRKRRGYTITREEMRRLARTWRRLVRQGVHCGSVLPPDVSIRRKESLRMASGKRPNRHLPNFNSPEARRPTTWRLPLRSASCGH